MHWPAPPTPGASGPDPERSSSRAFECVSHMAVSLSGSPARRLWVTGLTYLLAECGATQLPPGRDTLAVGSQ